MKRIPGLAVVPVRVSQGPNGAVGHVEWREPLDPLLLQTLGKALALVANSSSKTRKAALNVYSYVRASISAYLGAVRDVIKTTTTQNPDEVQLVLKLRIPSNLMEYMALLHRLDSSSNRTGKDGESYAVPWAAAVTCLRLLMLACISGPGSATYDKSLAFMEQTRQSGPSSSLGELNGRISLGTCLGTLL
jgi:hypothetical protein